MKCEKCGKPVKMRLIEKGKRVMVKYTCRYCGHKKTELEFNDE